MTHLKTIGFILIIVLGVATFFTALYELDKYFGVFGPLSLIAVLWFGCAYILVYNYFKDN